VTSATEAGDLAHRRAGRSCRPEGQRHSHAPVPTASLPRFSNLRAVCARCGGRRTIRVRFDRDCAGSATSRASASRASHGAPRPRSPSASRPPARHGASGRDARTSGCASELRPLLLQPLRHAPPCEAGSPSSSGPPHRGELTKQLSSVPDPRLLSGAGDYPLHGWPW